MPAAAALKEDRFVLSVQLLWQGHPRLCPVLFLLLDPVQIQSWQQLSGAAEASSFPELLAVFSMNQKGVQVPTGRTAQLAAGFSRGATEGRARARLLPSSLQRLLWACSHQRCVCAGFPLGRADGFGERRITGR